MKTICPYCKQLFPETPDEYLGMALECPMCKKEFVCEKVKFCSECETANSAKSLKCAGCGKFFPKAPATPQPPFQNQNSNSFAPDDSSEDNEREVKKIPWYKRGGEDVEHIGSPVVQPQGGGGALLVLKGQQHVVPVVVGDGGLKAQVVQPVLAHGVAVPGALVGVVHHPDEGVVAFVGQAIPIDVLVGGDHFQVVGGVGLQVVV